MINPELTTRWKEVYHLLHRTGRFKNNKDLSQKTGISTSAITEILKDRTGVGPNVVRLTLSAFPEVSETALREGIGPLIIGATSTTQSIGEQIRELKKLLDEGVITRAEFEKGKKKIFG